MRHDHALPADKRLTLRMSQELWHRLRTEAEKQDLSLTVLINRWLEEKLSSTAEPATLPEATADERMAQPDGIAGKPKSDRPIWEIIEELVSQVPEEDRATLPTDLAEQHDHYLYGTPKR